MCMWVSLDPPPSHVMGFQVVVLPPCFARPPQLVVRCGARTCIDGIVARFSAHGFLICFYCESLQSHMEGCCDDFWSCRPFSHAECLTLQKPNTITFGQFNSCKLESCFCGSLQRLSNGERLAKLTTQTKSFWIARSVTSVQILDWTIYQGHDMCGTKLLV